MDMNRMREMRKAYLSNFRHYSISKINVLLTYMVNEPSIEERKAEVLEILSRYGIAENTDNALKTSYKSKELTVNKETGTGGVIIEVYTTSDMEVITNEIRGAIHFSDVLDMSVINIREIIPHSPLMGLAHTIKNELPLGDTTLFKLVHPIMEKPIVLPIIEKIKDLPVETIAERFIDTICSNVAFEGRNLPNGYKIHFGTEVFDDVEELIDYFL